MTEEPRSRRDGSLKSIPLFEADSLQECDMCIDKRHTFEDKSLVKDYKCHSLVRMGNSITGV